MSLVYQFFWNTVYVQDLKCFRHSMQTASEASSPQHDDVRSARMASPSSRCHGDHVNTVTNSVQDGEGPSPSVVETSTGESRVSSSVPLAVLEEFSVGGVTDNEEAPVPPGGSTTARCRRSQFSSSRRKKQPLTTSNGPVSPPVPSVPPAGPGPPVDAVIVDMNSNDKDPTVGTPSPTSRCDGWNRTLDDDDNDDDTRAFGNDDIGNYDIGNYDADDAMLDFAERYFNAHPAQFSHSALARTVNIVTRKSLNVSIPHYNSS